MPRLTARQRALQAAQRTYRVAAALLIIGQAVGGGDVINPTSPSFLMFQMARHRLKKIAESRYIADRVYRKPTSLESVFEVDLRCEEDSTHWLNDREFKAKYRCSREALFRICEVIETHNIFKRGKRGPAQMAVVYQLMTLMHYFGNNGESNATQRNHFMISSGRTQLHRDRVVEALNSVRSDWIHWPDADERKSIAKRIETQFYFPNCTGMMDGTLLPLSIQPCCSDYEDYVGRKFQYSLTVNVINDDKRRIRAYLAGYPGSTHDNRVRSNMRQFKDPQAFFEVTEYVLCDSAYSPSDNAIPAYKKGSGNNTSQATFNGFLASPRVITEHTMGLWKGRFPWLRGIRMEITDNPESKLKLLKYIDATVVLHNMLIEFGEDNDESNPWTTVDDDISEIDEQLPERTILDSAVPEGSEHGARREQLKRYLTEYCFREYNDVIDPDLVGSDCESDISDSESSSG